MKRSGPLRRKVGVRRASAKRVAVEDDYRHAVWLVHLRDGSGCWARRMAMSITVPFPARCGGPIDPHHVWTLGRGGPRCDPANIRLLCRLHHDWAHGHPYAAEGIGLLASRITAL